MSRLKQSLRQQTRLTKMCLQLKQDETEAGQRSHNQGKAELKTRQQTKIPTLTNKSHSSNFAEEMSNSDSTYRMNIQCSCSNSVAFCQHHELKAESVTPSHGSIYRHGKPGQRSLSARRRMEEICCKLSQLLKDYITSTHTLEHS